MCQLLQRLPVGAVADEADDRIHAALAQRRDRLQHDSGVLDARHAADPADDERIARDPVQLPVVHVLGVAVQALGERDPEADHDELLRRRDPELHEVVAHLRAHGDERVRGAGERPLDLTEDRRPQRAEVAP